MNLLSLLSDLTKHDPHATIAIDVDPGRPVHVSRTELWRRTLQLRADLATAGVGRGDGVVVCLPNWSDVLDWHVATASLGAHVIGLDPGAGVEETELAHVLRRARPKVIALAHGVRPEGLRKRLADAAAQAGGTVPTVAVVAGPHGTPPIDPAPYDIGAGAWLPSTTTVGMPMPATHGDELAVAFAPSLAAHRESALVRHATATARAAGLRDDDVLACTRPLSDAVGMSAALAAIAGGATCLLEPDGDTSSLLGDLARFGATHLVTNADSLAPLERAWRAGPRDLGTWRWLGVTGIVGARPESIGWAERELGVHTTGLYGSADVLGFAALWPADAPTADRWSGGGHPISPDIGVRVVDPVTHRPRSVGEPGELQVRGYNVVDAFLGDADVITGRLTGDGWWPTGDAGTLTGDGGFHHIGRMSSAKHAGR